MTKRPEYLDGAPCWAELITPDRARAERFYGALFGWTFDAPQAHLGGYQIVRKDGAQVAALMELPPGQGVPPAWGVYLQVADVDAAARTIVAGGGQVVLAPHSVMHLGSMLQAVDPTGAPFGLWQPGEHRGAERFGAPGAMCWHELYTRDGAAADRFYRDLFGYEQTRHQGESADCSAMDYMLYKLGGRPVCGRMQMPAASGDLPPHWLTYFAVDDIDAAIATVRAHDGKLHEGPMQTPYGTMAMVGDPQGAVFEILQAPASA